MGLYSNRVKQRTNKQMNNIKSDSIKHCWEVDKGTEWHATSSAVIREGLLLSRDLNDLQESAAWRVREGGALPAQETRTNAAEEEHAWDVTKKARRSAWLPNYTGQGNIGGGEAGRLPAASGPHLSQLQLCNHGQLSVVQFPHLQNTIYLAGYREDWKIT